MSAWTVDVRAPGDTWRTTEEKPSADACKAWAREHRKWQPFCHYRIYDDLGRLAFYSDPAGKTRMMWRWGPLSEREPAAKGAGQ